MPITAEATFFGEELCLLKLCRPPSRTLGALQHHCNPESRCGDDTNMHIWLQPTTSWLVNQYRNKVMNKLPCKLPSLWYWWKCRAVSFSLDTISRFCAAHLTFIFCSVLIVLDSFFSFSFVSLTPKRQLSSMSVMLSPASHLPKDTYNEWVGVQGRSARWQLSLSQTQRRQTNTHTHTSDLRLINLSFCSNWASLFQHGLNNTPALTGGKCLIFAAASSRLWIQLTPSSLLLSLSLIFSLSAF